MAPVERITLFKIPNEGDLPSLEEQYKILVANAKKDGKPYILTVAAGKCFPDPRNKGFNFSVKTTFASMEDMEYYDKECAAHQALKAYVAPIKEDILTTYFVSAV
ncbi:hypothetical protein MPDQ_003700 [Monascus purpureus]|uniref:Stress-response A/B barrel domain-containing protein n=1 Tax=Monascus purpureus TaxID=5098 RepID=A0A507QME2_MONPU|nr:hypothetical protein MPDQ_003700 [Monascus purpureus]BDD58267.1 hypothetical protein MAP00_003561 [Monascus purpureus]